MPSGVVEIYSQQVTSPHRGAWARINAAPPVYSNRPRKSENTGGEKEHSQQQHQHQHQQRQRPSTASAVPSSASPQHMGSPSPMRISSHLPTSPYPEPAYREPAVDDQVHQEENDLLRLRIAELEERLASERRIADMRARHKAGKAPRSPSPSRRKVDAQLRSDNMRPATLSPVRDNFLHTAPLSGLEPLTGSQYQAIDGVMARLNGFMTKRSKFKEDFIHTFSNPEYRSPSKGSQTAPRSDLRGDPLRDVRRRIQIHERAATKAQELGVMYGDVTEAARAGKKRRPKSASAAQRSKRSGRGPVAALKKRRRKKKNKLTRSANQLGASVNGRRRGGFETADAAIDDEDGEDDGDDEDGDWEVEKEGNQAERHDDVMGTAAFETMRQTRAARDENFAWVPAEFEDSLHEAMALPGQTLGAKALETLRRDEISPRATIGWDATAEMARRGERGGLMSDKELRSSRRQFQAVAAAAVLRLQQWIRGIMCRQRLIRENAAIAVLVPNCRGFAAKLHVHRRRRAAALLPIRMRYLIQLKQRRRRRAALRIQCFRRYRTATRRTGTLRAARHKRWSAAALRIQCSFHCNVARVKVRGIRDARAVAARRNSAALTLQSRARGTAVRQRERARHETAAIVERAWRCCCARRMRRRHVAAATVQRLVRCSQARRTVASVRRFARRRAAAQRIQALERGRRGRQKAKLERLEREKNDAARRIQKRLRVRAARVQRAKVLRRRCSASIALQCFVRSSLARAETTRRRTARQMRRRIASATCIQQTARRYIVRARMLRVKAAVVMQCYARLWAARQRVKMVRAFADANLSTGSAAKIQAACRGRRDRLRVKELVSRREDAAVALQCAIRCAVSRHDAQSRRTRLNLAAVAVQLLLRRRMALRRTRLLRRQHLCAGELQRVWRGRGGRGKARDKQHVRDRGRAVALLQGFCRIACAKVEVSRRKALKKRVKAAVRLQSMARMWHHQYPKMGDIRRRLRLRRNAKAQRSAIALQCAVRQRQARAVLRMKRISAKSVTRTVVVVPKEESPTNNKAPFAIGGLGPGFGTFGADIFFDDSIAESGEVEEAPSVADVAAKPAEETETKPGRDDQKSNGGDDEFDISITEGSKASQPSEPPGEPPTTLVGKDGSVVSRTPSSPPPSVPDLSVGGLESLDASQPSAVPGGTSRWTVHIDPATQHKYYHDVETGETTWTEPEALIQARLAANGGTSAANSVVTESKSMHSTNSVSLGQQGNWIKYIDEGSTAPYWYNIKTQRSSWTKPPGWKDEEPKSLRSPDKISGAEPAAIQALSAIAVTSSPSTTSAGAGGAGAGDSEAEASKSPQLDRKASANSMTSASVGGGEEQQGNWVKYVDESSTTPYYYNVLSKKSSWTRPPGWQGSANNSPVPTHQSPQPYDSGSFVAAIRENAVPSNISPGEGGGGIQMEGAPFRLHQNPRFANVLGEQQQQQAQQPQQQPQPQLQPRPQLYPTFQQQQQQQQQQRQHQPFQLQPTLHAQPMPWQQHPQSQPQPQPMFAQHPVQQPMQMPWQQPQQPFRLQATMQPPMGAMPWQRPQQPQPQPQQPFQFQQPSQMPLGSMPWQQQQQAPHNGMGGVVMPTGGRGGGGMGSGVVTNNNNSNTTPIQPFTQADSDSDDSYKIPSYNIGF